MASSIRPMREKGPKPGDEGWRKHNLTLEA